MFEQYKKVDDDALLNLDFATMEARLVSVVESIAEADPDDKSLLALNMGVVIGFLGLTLRKLALMEKEKNDATTA